MYFVTWKARGSVGTMAARRSQSVRFETGSTSEKRSPVKRERPRSRDSASSCRSSKASSKSRWAGGAPQLRCDLEISGTDEEGVCLTWDWTGREGNPEELGFLERKRFPGLGPGNVRSFGRTARFSGSSPGGTLWTLSRVWGPVRVGGGRGPCPRGSPGLDSQEERSKVNCSRRVWGAER